jgi:hypothetical protein
MEGSPPAVFVLKGAGRHLASPSAIWPISAILSLQYTR